mgnify:CR=1 FL=1
MIQKLDKNEKLKKDFDIIIKDVLTYFSQPKKLLVSRTFEELVKATEKELNNGVQLIHNSYHRIDDKVKLVLDQAEQQRCEKIFIFGDLQNDIDPATEARKLGYDVFMARVCKQMLRKHYHSDVDLYMQRNWTGLRDMLIS